MYVISSVDVRNPAAYPRPIRSSHIRHMRRTPNAYSSSTDENAVLRLITPCSRPLGKCSTVVIATSCECATMTCRSASIGRRRPLTALNGATSSTCCSTSSMIMTLCGWIQFSNRKKCCHDQCSSLRAAMECALIHSAHDSTSRDPEMLIATYSTPSTNHFSSGRTTVELIPDAEMRRL